MSEEKARDASADEDEDGRTPEVRGKIPEPVERTVDSQHTTTVGGRELTYTARAGTLVLRDDDGKARASVFYVAYTLDDTDPRQRPVTFAYNGGPGSAALWLQLGTFGPRRVDMPDAIHPPPPPYALVDNAESILDLTDLVFIDPVQTGYSKPEGEAKPEEFHGVQEDIESVGEFVRLWTTRHSRWSSPKLLAGESYGTLRSAGLVDHLQQKGMAFNGVLLISMILDLGTVLFEPSALLPPVLHLPTYAATAWYHDALPERPAELLPFLEEVCAFARGEYLAALAQGSRLSEEDAERIVERLHRYTGLSLPYLRRTRIRPEIERFCKELLRGRGRTVGRLDTRYLGVDIDDAGEHCEHDPSLTAPFGPFAGAMQDYLRRELRYEEDRAYHALNFAVNEGWRWPVKGRLGAPSTADALRRAMQRNPHLRVFVAQGYYDLATPFFAAEHTLDNLGLPSADLSRIDVAYYEAGHMMYFHPPSRTKLKADLSAFFARSVVLPPV